MSKVILGNLKRQIAVSERKLQSLEKKEEQVRLRWRKDNEKFINASEDIAVLKKRGTKREKKLKEIIKSWRATNKTLTIERDGARKAIDEERKKLEKLKSHLDKYIAEFEAVIKATDEIVNQTFVLSEIISRASGQRDIYLAQQIFPSLIGTDGNLRTQKTFDSSDGKRRVVAVVNIKTRIDAFLATEAKKKVEEFFDRFQSTVGMDENTEILYELTRKLLVEKTSFNIGPHLYRFLSLRLEGSRYPELEEAQRLLIMSLRNEKSSPYVRLFKRESLSSRWKQCKMGV